MVRRPDLQNEVPHANEPEARWHSSRQHRYRPTSTGPRKRLASRFYQLRTKYRLSLISRGMLVSTAAGAAVTLVTLWLALITAAAATVILRA